MNPKRQVQTPSYRLHKPCGQAVVRINCRDYYLGKHGTEESRCKYDRLIAEWLANGRRMPSQGDKSPDLTVNEIILAYWRFAEGYYLKDGRPTSELVSIHESLRILKRLYGKAWANGGGPGALRACQQTMIEAGLSRGVINGRVGRIKRMFKWAASHGLVRIDAYQALATVGGLKRGRSSAREPEPVRPVPETHIAAILPQGIPPDSGHDRTPTLDRYAAGRGSAYAHRSTSTWRTRSGNTDPKAINRNTTGGSVSSSSGRVLRRSLCRS